MSIQIYEIKIGDNYYIGKDKYNQRRGQHMRMLESNTHYNTFMQNSFNKYSDFSYRKVHEFPNNSISDKELSNLEIETISKYREKYGKNKVMNLTDGGDGGKGHIKNQLQIETARKTMMENNPTRKIDRSAVSKIYDMFDDNKTNQEIGKEFNLHPGYISQIRVGSKYKDLFELRYKDKKPLPSLGRGRISYDMFLTVVTLKETGLNYVEISKETGLDRSVINRLCLKQTYKNYWKMYEEE